MKTSLVRSRPLVPTLDYSETDLRFRVDGLPVPQGSHRSVPTGQHFSPRTGQMERTHRIIDSNPNLMPWRARVVAEAVRAHRGRPPFNGEVFVLLWFGFPYLNRHLKMDGSIRPSAPTLKRTKPDIDKLERAILDGLVEAGVIVEDGRVCGVLKFKGYSIRPGVIVALRERMPCELGGEPT